MRPWLPPTAASGTQRRPGARGQRPVMPRACTPHRRPLTAPPPTWLHWRGGRRVLTGASNLVVGGSLDGVPPQLLAGDANVRGVDRSKELEVALAVQAQRVHALYQSQLRDPAAFARQRLLLAECEDAVARGDAGAVPALLRGEGEAADPPTHRIAPGLSVLAVDEGAIALPQWLHLRAAARGEAPREPSPLAQALWRAASALRAAPAEESVLVVSPSLWFHAPALPEDSGAQATLLSQWGRRAEEAEAALALGLAAAEKGADAGPGGEAYGAGPLDWAPGTAVVLRCGVASAPELGSLRTGSSHCTVIAVPPWQQPLMEPDAKPASTARLVRGRRPATCTPLCSLPARLLTPVPRPAGQPRGGVFARAVGGRGGRCRDPAPAPPPPLGPPRSGGGETCPHSCPGVAPP